MKILILDNYDSFTYNLYQYVGELLSSSKEPFTLDVVRNDAVTLDEIQERKYDRIIISPGPGDPSDKKYFGVCSGVITQLGKTTPVLGVCLGMTGRASSRDCRRDSKLCGIIHLSRTPRACRRASRFPPGRGIRGRSWACATESTR